MNQQNYKNKTADILYNKMLMTTPDDVATEALKIMNSVQTDKTENQLLGIAAVMIVLLEQYGLSHVDVLGIADNMVYSGFNNNMKPQFKAIKQFMKDEWEI